MALCIQNTKSQHQGCGFVLGHLFTVHKVLVLISSTVKKKIQSPTVRWGTHIKNQVC